MKRRRHRKKNWDGHFYIQACSYIQTCLTHNCAFTQRLYHTHTFLHTDVIHTNTFTHRDVFAHKTLLDTKVFWHTDSFTHKPFFTHLCAQSPFTHKHFYTQKHDTCSQAYARIVKHATSLNSSRDTTLSQAGHTWSLLHTQLLLHTAAFTYRRFSTESLLHRHTFTHKPLYSKTLVRTLAQNNFCEFWCEMHLTCKNTPIIPDRNGSVRRPEKESWSNHRHSQC